jgi:hypothetical protein
MARCRKNGCRKRGRHPSAFCINHTSEWIYPTPKDKVVHPTSTAVQGRGYFGKFLFSNKEAFEMISKIAYEDPRLRDPNTIVTKCRFHQNYEGTELQPLLGLIVQEARARIKFPIKSKARVQEPILVVAPPVSSRKNSWTCGSIHRDFDTVEESGVYTFYLCLEGMTEHNGPIKLWARSKNCPCEAHNRGRGIERMKLKSEILLGGQGTVFVWDSRLLHQSLPNKNGIMRMGLAWVVNSSRKPALQRVENTDDDKGTG